jgi:hypothetical protein
MRGDEAAVQDFSTQCRNLLDEASFHLKILDPEHGGEELIASVTAEYDKLSLHLRKP